jgi:hypothetical protein
MNFIFNYDQKIFLTGKSSTHVSVKTRNSVLQKISREPKRDEQTSLLIVCASRVDRIDLCAKFPASTSGGQTLSKL